VISIERATKLNPNLNPELFLPSPQDVLRAIDEEPVRSWLKFISEEHMAPKRRLLLLVPCTPKKPYDPPRDELHRRLLELEKKHDVYLVSVSEPLALEPREYWNFKWRGINLIYDAPFFPWIEKYGYKWDKSIVFEVWNRLAKVAERWYNRNSHFKKVVCFATPNSGYRCIVRKIGIDVFVPDFEPSVDVDYEENTDRIYTHPKVWKSLLEALEKL